MIWVHPLFAPHGNSEATTQPAHSKKGGHVRITASGSKSNCTTSRGCSSSNNKCVAAVA